MERYIGLDAHATSCTFAVLSERGRRLDSAVVETNGRALVKFLRGVPGNKHLCLEEGTQSAWLYEVLQGHVRELVVTHAFERNRGPKDDQRDAFHLANSLRLGAVSPVYKDAGQMGELRAHADVYAKLVTDVVRAQNRLKALFRSRGVQVVGGAVYTQRDRQAYLDKLARPYRGSAELLYSELDALRAIKKEAEKQLIAQSHRHSISAVLQTCPGMGPIRVAETIPIIVSPHRFRTARQLWASSGLAIVMRSSKQRPFPVHAPRDITSSTAKLGAQPEPDGLRGQFSNGAFSNSLTCENCHRRDSTQGFFGTGKDASFEAETQIFKIPHFRNLYQKVGMFGMPDTEFILNANQGGGDDFSHMGNQVRGTGFIHDGSIDTLFRFFRARVFSQGFVLGDQNVGFDGGNSQRRDVEDLMLAFDSDLTPIVGQQVTLDDTNLADVSARIDLLEQRAAASFTSAILGGLVTECDLVAKGRWNNRIGSALYDPSTDEYTPDSQGDSPITSAGMRAIAQTAGQAITYMCVPPGSGVRIGLDRDSDGVWNYDEGLSSTQADNPGSVPGACNDGDGLIDVADPGCPTPSSNIENTQCNDGFDNDADALTDLADPHCSDPSSN